MRRTAAVLLTSVALGASALVAAPAATAATCYDSPTTYTTHPCADPVAVSVSASPASVVITGSASIALTAVFDDVDNTVRGVDFTVGIPGGTTRNAYATGYVAKVGNRKTFRAIYNAYDFYRPGTYTLQAVATRDSSTTTAFAGVPTATGSFVVKHKSSVTIYPSKYVFYKNSKLSFSGSVRGTTDVAKLSVKVQFKKSGSNKYVTKQTVKTTTAGTYKTKKFKMSKSGLWRTVVANKGYVVGSTSTVLKAKIRSAR